MVIFHSKMLVYQRVYSTFHHISVSLETLDLRSPRWQVHQEISCRMQTARMIDDSSEEWMRHGETGDMRELCLAHGQPNTISHFIFMLDICFSPYFLFYKKSRIVL